MYSSAAVHRTDYQSTEALRQIPPAGKTDNTGETARDAVSWQERPPTPEVIKPFQHYARQPAGTITRHFGTARDPVQQGPFGSKTKASQESAAECMATYPDSEIGRWKLEKCEEVYASTKREPLGHTYSRGHQIPAGLGTQVAFGKPLHTQEQETQNSTKSIIFPEQRHSDSHSDCTLHRMYVASHGSFAPGEQRKRDYDWSRTKVDPVSQRFGYVEKPQHSTVKQILQPELEGDALQQPVVSKVYDRYKATLGDELGRPRILGAGNRGADPNHVFGKASARAQEPCVGELVRGYYTPEEQAPDPDLGKSLHEGWRNTEVPGRTFGVPSVRNDIPPAANRSIANTKNYGNEPSAAQLLTPPKCVDLGVKEEHLLAQRSRPELMELIAEAGIAIEAHEFAAIFSLASEAEGVPVEMQQCSLDGFLKARQYYLAQQAGLR